jgi:quercetin dioxygenase-like cupin family protein
VKYFYNQWMMRKSRVAGLVLLATAALAQQQQTVEITSEPSHHQVLENQYVRVFNVTVAPKAKTLIHRHNYDYLFVTLGDSDLINARVGEQPVPLQLKDGDVRYTPGHFAHAAINQSDQPFHNITIELLKPSSNVKRCTERCELPPPDSPSRRELGPEGLPRIESLWGASQWKVWSCTMPPSIPLFRSTGRSFPALFVAVTDLNLSLQGDKNGAQNPLRHAGDIAWIAPDTPYTVRNSGKQAQFVILEFTAETPKP